MIYPIETAADRINFIVTVTSLVISFLAFIIAMNTYISIDSVNRVTQMTGNVLENDQYKTSLSDLLVYNKKDYNQAGEAIFNELELRFHKQSKTAVEFSNHLQYFIDIIVLFPVLFNTSDKKHHTYKNRMDKLLETIIKRKNTLLAISSGNLTLIEETVKLIHSVVYYQQLMPTSNYSVPPTILEVKGSMLKNPVTQTVYYNYLGLFYNKKAMALLGKQLQMENSDFFDISNHKKLLQHLHLITDDDKQTLLIYLEEARKAFDLALKNGQGEILWEAFIFYNDARTIYFLDLIHPQRKNDRWKKRMDQAIQSRIRLNLLIKDISSQQGNYVQQHFLHQEKLAKLVKINILIALNEDISDIHGNVQYTQPKYKGLEKDNLLLDHEDASYPKIKLYQETIRKLL